MINKLLHILGYQLIESWMICDGGECMPKSQAMRLRKLNPQPIDIEWIEESRRGWAKLVGKLKSEMPNNGLQPTPKGAGEKSC